MCVCLKFNMFEEAEEERVCRLCLWLLLTHIISCKKPLPSYKSQQHLTPDCPLSG